MDIKQSIEKFNSAITKNEYKDKLEAMAAFNNVLDKHPKKEWIKDNRGVFYIPIRVVEQTLRSFFGVYQVEMIGQPQVLANSVVCSVHLKVFHPVMQEWLIYAGTGAVPMQLDKGANVMEIDKLKRDALHKNLPAALSFAVSNASKKIGKIFGSHLNGIDDITQFTLIQEDE